MIKNACVCGDCLSCEVRLFAKKSLTRRLGKSRLRDSWIDDVVVTKPKPPRPTSPVAPTDASDRRQRVLDLMRKTGLPESAVVAFLEVSG